MALPVPRTTPELVKKLVDVQVDFDLMPMIRSANILTTKVCGHSGYEDDGPDSHMELIERWLSAHFYCVFDNQLTMAKAGTAAVGFQQKIDLGLRCTEYGQQAMLLDIEGNLAALENTQETKRKIKVEIGWLGTNRRAWPLGYWPNITVIP